MCNKINTNAANIFNRGADTIGSSVAYKDVKQDISPIFFGYFADKIKSVTGKSG